MKKIENKLHYGFITKRSYPEKLSFSSSSVHFPPKAQAGDLVRSTAAARRGTAPGKVEEKVERALSGLFYRETRQKPVVMVALVEV